RRELDALLGSAAQVTSPTGPGGWDMMGMAEFRPNLGAQNRCIPVANRAGIAALPPPVDKKVAVLSGPGLAHDDERVRLLTAVRRFVSYSGS
ncbi:MAG TPA: hypothetical protein VKE98_00160, partial [Gemmataceae bacterium]|nr:hypothetical protein [Gemmataceae bacterium]